jgi:hypothetical protein
MKRTPQLTMEEIATPREKRPGFAMTLNCGFLFLRETLSAMWANFVMTPIMIIYETK